MNYYFSSDYKLGILGGGQLGKMLLCETRKFDIQTFVLDPNEEAPARIGCDKFYQGSLLDFDTVYQFGKKVDLLTLEIEHVNLEALEKLEEEGLAIYPSPKTLRLIQNKGQQKDFYSKNNIPTSVYQRFVDITDLKEAIKKNELEFPFVWKSAQGGYDGNGVKIVRSSIDLLDLPEVECLAEDLVSFKNELAVIVARNPKGEIKTYPVVEMEFHPEANQVEYTICPARIDDTVAQKAREVALKVSEAMNHVGLLAVEMFQTVDDDILVNEVAPRPHNSGHYSIEASYTSQFEQHLRAILDLPLGNTNSKVAGIMVNLVGEEGYSGQVVYKNIGQIMAIEGVTPHIYGKRETRPFRKMGHVTIVNENMSEARRIAEEVKNNIRVISQ
ncbi:5-(carboxyamino)imidazole ribonucleotide synthase [Flavobacterium columnare]|uniref:N5-carboxyaminoimidazole ribonucleotide synthase n=1 Tax=Flavobacterium columnare (strain ATCC 49512 / CIP 103533 / TG 44/87) TaxID=1041826 RepID=G8X779_FLACA|nr:5-(carboxyamino)imidazole ribonucleotide synthase [Flavobacterium columnare]AEW87064.1 phosphoribosylaminoimidazole carboxylase [Flavobacterium columnare ATCC 49512]MBF6651419.1 5-(carboxyamino)imidazole ribonucleotide synthase [Flavobacterium columnare]MBF6655224.1 5-(carboxyamino)imidazole ribonucleotide synthase [Flavobacterium columnare]MBF6658104.1 5-(carboxyamino)imidazole ribonucleotide synthase [Flavobacterium columnare]MEB3802090.1 5-(carboxyamino)imidazole ribonucleotide synthase 